MNATLKYPAATTAAVDPAKEILELAFATTRPLSR